MKCKKRTAILSNCHMWLHKTIKYSDNLKYQCRVMYLLISPIRTSAASYSYIRNRVKICKFFNPLCFIWFIKNITYYCLFLYYSKIKKWIQQADSYILIPVWDLPDDNLLSCEWDFNWCNALLFHSSSEYQ